ncbi:hypothetical protein SAMN05216413_2602 [Ruminococcaceae bacterium KH2T8]|nr:hypothetical protein SAMN05216413_2602 [Ruminococcaceae bacterium KH2T8]
MVFKNKKHAERFFTACAENCISMDDKTFLAAVYLLTCRRKLWDEFKDKVLIETGIPDSAFHKFIPRNAVEEALATAAFDIFHISDCICLTDLGDRDEVPDEAFLAICHAIGYLRFGFNDGLTEPYTLEYA